MSKAEIWKCPGCSKDFNSKLAISGKKGSAFCPKCQAASIPACFQKGKK